MTATGAALAAPALLVVGVLALLAAGAALVWARRVARRAHPAELPLEWAAGAVCDAYVALGEMTAEVARTMSFTVRPEGWVRVGLPDADAEVSRRVTAALDELYGGGALARYVVSRKVLPAHTAWHPVPADLARRKDRAEAFHAAWQRWMGAGELVYCHGADARGTDLAAQASHVPALETQRRRIWR